MLAQPALGRPGFRSFSLLLGHRLGGAGAAQLWSIFEQVPDWTAQLVLNLLARLAHWLRDQPSESTEEAMAYARLLLENGLTRLKAVANALAEESEQESYLTCANRSNHAPPSQPANRAPLRIGRPSPVRPQGQ